MASLAVNFRGGGGASGGGASGGGASGDEGLGRGGATDGEGRCGGAIDGSSWSSFSDSTGMMVVSGAGSPRGVHACSLIGVLARETRPLLLGVDGREDVVLEGEVEECCWCIEVELWCCCGCSSSTTAGRSNDSVSTMLRLSYQMATTSDKTS